MAKVVKMRGAKTPRSPRRRTFTVKADGETMATTPDLTLAQWIAREFLNHRKSVAITDNATRKRVARYIYGHRQ